MFFFVCAADELPAVSVCEKVLGLLISDPVLKHKSLARTLLLPLYLYLIVTHHNRNVWHVDVHMTVHGMMAQQQSSSQTHPFLGGLTMLAIVEEAGLDPAGGIVFACG